MQVGYGRLKKHLTFVSESKTLVKHSKQSLKWLTTIEIKHQKDAQSVKINCVEQF